MYFVKCTGRKREFLSGISRHALRIGLRTLIGRVCGSRLRLRHVVVPLVSRRRRRLCHGFLLVHWCGRRVLPRWHSFVYGVQTLGLGERGDFVIWREALESWQKKNVRLIEALHIHYILYYCATVYILSSRNYLN